MKTKTSEMSLTRRSKDMEERISGLEDKVKEIYILGKENVKSKNKQTNSRHKISRKSGTL